jgi:SAM-dependent methyltransferase
MPGTCSGAGYASVRFMWPDIVDLRDFYDSGLGHVARRMIRRQLRAMWPDVAGMNLLGLGYAAPYLRTFQDEAARTIAAMPSGMGVLAWAGAADGARNLAMLAQEDGLPLPDLSMDRILLVHSLEHSEHLRDMLREVWRVLADGGRLIVVVPNRRSIWARFEHTPFGHGQPYTPNQINGILRGAMFAPMRSAVCLYMPPTRRHFWLKTAPAWEKVGERWFAPLGGVTIVEASKQIYGGIPAAATARRRGYVRVGASAGGG